MDIGKAITFVYEDPEWIKKIAIGGLFALFSWLLLPLFVLYGYQIAVTRNVIKKGHSPLPEWDDIGAMLGDGIKIWAAQIVYALPFILISLCSTFLFFLPAADTGSGSVDSLEALSLIAILASSCLILLFILVLIFVTPALYVQYARFGTFGAMLRFGEILAIIRAHAVDIFLALAVGLVGGMVLSFVSSVLWLTVCGGIIASFGGTVWLMVTSAHLYGQIGSKIEGSKTELGYGM